MRDGKPRHEQRHGKADERDRDEGAKRPGRRAERRKHDRGPLDQDPPCHRIGGGDPIEPFGSRYV